MRLRRALLGALILLPLRADAQPIRVASWNLGQGSHPEAIARGLAAPPLSAECDILALQETQTADGVDLAAELAAERKWRWTGNASNAIVSRWPIRRSGRATIGVERTRELPWADIESPLGLIRVYSVHLTFRSGLWPFEEELRFREIGWILYHLTKTEPPADPDAPVVIAGDFNTVGRLLWGHHNEKGLRLLGSRGFLAAPGDGATHPVFGRLDWVFARGLRPVDGGVGELSGSDHRWLWARLEQPSGDPPQSAPVRGVSYAAPAVLAALLAAAVTVWIARRRRARRRLR